MTDSIEIQVNGISRSVDASLTVAELLRELKVTSEHTAVELNRTILLKTNYDRQLQPGDELEIVQFVGGG